MSIDHIARLKDQLERRDKRIESLDQEIRELRLANARFGMRETEFKREIDSLRRALGQAYRYHPKQQVAIAEPIVEQIYSGPVATAAPGTHTMR